ncbi:MAG TPA: hypothetical protein VFH79_07865 [Candidatus Limnocylindria bacterium]|jgi:hypothetical protein|nr:hypothetical protein [Candidatus Limnocylindria bacterium]
MTTTDPDRTPGYRGALPPREDRLARPWILLVIAAFVLILVLSVLGIPSRFIPEPTPVPLPSVPAPSFSVEPSASSSASASASPSASEEASPSPTSE